MAVEQILFYLFSALLLGTALFVVTIKNLVRSIFMFFIVLFALAGLYIFAMADFIAVAQVVIYVGGVLVLMIFAFLLSNKELLADLQITGRLINAPGMLVALIFLVVLISAIAGAGIEHISWLDSHPENQIKPSDNTAHNIGVNIMTNYLLPFEVVSLFLLMALIGAAHMARKDLKQ